MGNIYAGESLRAADKKKFHERYGHPLKFAIHYPLDALILVGLWFARFACLGIAGFMLAGSKFMYQGTNTSIPLTTVLFILGGLLIFAFTKIRKFRWTKIERDQFMWVREAKAKEQGQGQVTVSAELLAQLLEAKNQTKN